MTSMLTTLRVGACLSLTGRYARFGTQIADALKVWQSFDGLSELVIEDDESDPARLEEKLPDVAGRSDVLLGPYSTQLMRRAAQLATDDSWLLWNHGGSGDSVEEGFPGHVVSILTPTSRYAEPFLKLLANTSSNLPLRIVQGRGGFARQVAQGAERHAATLGIENVIRIPAAELTIAPPPYPWVMVSAGTFEDDVDLVREALAMSNPPRQICAVAAGVQEFNQHIDDPRGIFGIAQWFRNGDQRPALGPSESEFLQAYKTRTESAEPDYPAIQAVAAAVIATHCARAVGTTARNALWASAIELSASTLFGDFAVDRKTGKQIAHDTVLTRWNTTGLAALGRHA